MQRKPQYVNGYRMVYVPTHPHAIKSSKHKGYVYEHRLIVEQDIGHLLRRDEAVHHINGNKLDNRLSNLLVLSNKEHSRLHAFLRKQKRQLEGNDGGEDNHNVKEDNHNVKKEQDPNKREITKLERSLQRRKPYLVELLGQVLMYPMTTVAKKYGVTDNAVRKWCNSYGIKVHKHWYSLSLSQKEQLVKWQNHQRFKVPKNAKAVVKIDHSGTPDMIFSSADETKKYGFTPQQVRRACSQRHKEKVKGYRWRYASPEEKKLLKDERVYMFAKIAI